MDHLIREIEYGYHIYLYKTYLYNGQNIDQIPRYKDTTYNTMIEGWYQEYVNRIDSLYIDSLYIDSLYILWQWTISYILYFLNTTWSIMNTNKESNREITTWVKSNREITTWV